MDIYRIRNVGIIVAQIAGTKDVAWSRKKPEGGGFESG
jgi:hypothetical protein